MHLVGAFLAKPQLAAVAQRQHGMVATAQLNEVGVARRAIASAVKHGWLHPYMHGVYAVGHERVTYQGRLWAAVLATNGVLSHRSAAAAWDLMPPPAGPIDVTTTRNSRSREGIRVHRTKALSPGDVVQDEDGLPRTSVARTLTDLADVLNERQMKRVVERAEILRILDVRDLPGRRKVRVAPEPHFTRSELERRMRALAKRHRLPQPSVNANVLGHEVDFFWREHRVVAETDGAETHLTRAAFERDRRRDADLVVAGYKVVRFTWRQLAGDPRYVAETLKRLL
jgi:very-short-patch-repair endonuclease